MSQWNLDFDVEESEITAFADAWKNFLSGKPSLTISVQGALDQAASQGDATIFAALTSAALAWDAEFDGATGYNGYGFPTKYSISVPVNGHVTYSATIRHNGTSAAADGGAPNRA